MYKRLKFAVNDRVIVTKTPSEFGKFGWGIGPPIGAKGTVTGLNGTDIIVRFDPPYTGHNSGWDTRRFGFLLQEGAMKERKRRRKNDFYPTPKELTQALVHHSGWKSEHKLAFYEPCNGDGAISNILSTLGTITTADIDLIKDPMYILDARKEWPHYGNECYDWVVTNPPFNCAYEIVSNLLNHRDNILKGFALLLRLSFLEPTNERADFLRYCPPSDIIVLPRASFTGDGKTDSVTCAWMVWDWENMKYGKQTIRVYTKKDLKLLSEGKPLPSFTHGELKYGQLDKGQVRKEYNYSRDRDNPLP